MKILPQTPRPASSARRRAGAALLACAASLACAAHADDGTLAWRWQVLPAADGSGDAEVVISTDIRPGWIVYASDFQAPEFGPRPATLSLASAPGISAAGGLASPGSREADGRNFAGGYRYTYFSGQAEFRQRVRIGEARSIDGTISGQTCFEETGLCTLFRESFAIALD